MSNKPARWCAAIVQVAALVFSLSSSPIKAGDFSEAESPAFSQEKAPFNYDWEKTDREQDRRWDIDGLLDGLSIRPGQMIGDLGAGGGYLTFKLARRVAPDGRIFAEDINPMFLTALETRASERGLTNIEVIRGSEYEPRFPAGQLDMIFMRAVIYFIDDRPRFLQAAGAGLKEGGRFVLIESESGDSSPDDGVFGMSRYPTRKGYLEIFRRAGFILVSAETIKVRVAIPSGLSENTVFVLKREARSRS